MHASVSSSSSHSQSSSTRSDMTIPSGLKFAGTKDEWPVWKNKFTAWCGMNKMVDVLHKALQDAGAAASSASAAAEAAGGAAKSEDEKDNAEKAARTAAEAQAAYAAFVDRAMRVYTVLLLSLQSRTLSQLVRNVPVGDAYGVWQLLLGKFERKTIASQIQLWDELHGEKLASGESIDAYVARIQGLSVLLTDMGETLSDGLLKTVLLKGLPASFDPVVPSLRLQAKTLSFDDMVTHLEDHQESMQIKDRKESAAAEEAASYVRDHGARPQQQRYGRSSGGGAGHSRGNGNGNSARRLCYDCDSPSHIAFDCPKNRDAKKCSLCRQLGHVDKQCQRPRRGRGAFEQQQRQQQQQPQRQRAGASSSSRAAATDDEDESGHLAADSSDEGSEDFALLAQQTEPVSVSRTHHIVKWVFDSGATQNLCNNQSIMHNVHRVSPPVVLRVADNKLMYLERAGQVHLQVRSGRTLTLGTVVYDPRLAANLLSVPRLTASGYDVTFGENAAEVRSRATRRLVCVAHRRGKLYVLEQHVHGGAPVDAHREHKQAEPDDDGLAALQLASAPDNDKASDVKASLTTDELWHGRLGHVHEQRLQKLSAAGVLGGLPKLTVGAWLSRTVAPESVCAACALGKKHRHVFQKQRSESAQAHAPLQRVWADLSGPIVVKARSNAQTELVSSLGGCTYLSVIVDEATRKVWAWPLASKAEAAGKIITWCRQVQRRLGRKLVEFHTDGGGEYAAGKLASFFSAEGIQHTTTQAHTPQHNGIAERMNRTLFEMARCMLQHAKLGAEFWAMAVQTAAYLCNRTKTVLLTKAAGAAADGGADGGAQAQAVTPEHAWTGHKPNVSHLRIFGSDCYRHVADSERGGKMGAKAMPCILVGYAESRPGYRVLDLTSRKVVETRDVSFNEGVFSFRGEQLKAALGQHGAHDDERTLEDIVDNMQLEFDIRAAIIMSEAENSGAQRAQREEAEAPAAPGAGPAAAAVGPGVSVSVAEATEADGSGSGSAVRPAAPEAPSDPDADAAQPAGVHVRVRAKAAAPAAEDEPSEQSAKKNPGRSSRATVNYRGMLAMEAESEPWSSPCSSSLQTAEAQAEQAYQASESGATDPVSYRDAMRRPDAAQWRRAMEEEMGAHDRNGTWLLVERPQGETILANMWVCKVKMDVDGRPERYKARVVAKGFMQVHGVHFHERHAPTLRGECLRSLLIAAALEDLELQQLDVTTAYLNARLEERVYMHQPEGFADPQRPDHVCELKKGLYGLMQSGHMWNKEVNGFLTAALGFVPCRSDPCLYWKLSRTGRKLLLGLFVDDIVVAFDRKDGAEWAQLKAAFMEKYRSKDLGDAALVLGMRIRRDRSRRRLQLDQQTYVEKILAQHNMQQCKSVATPECSSVSLTLADCPSEAEAHRDEHVQRRLHYERLVGALLYAAMCTRPDIAHAVNQLSRFLKAPGEKHWRAAKLVLRYLSGTRALGLTFEPTAGSLKDQHSGGKGAGHGQGDREVRQGGGDVDGERERERECPLVLWCDADWAGCVDSRKSTTGHVLQLHGCTLSWMSKKQSTVALSSTEAEYMAISMALREAKWARALLHEIRGTVRVAAAGAGPDTKGKGNAHSNKATHDEDEGESDRECVPLVEIRCDNQSALAIVSRPGAMHARTKHIDVRHHFVRDAVKAGEVRVQWVPSAEQLADIFTKPLDRHTFITLRDAIMGGQVA